MLTIRFQLNNSKHRRNLNNRVPTTLDQKLVILINYKSSKVKVKQKF